MKLRISKTGCILTATVILAILLRLLYLGRESLWFDELASVAIAKLDWSNFWRIVSRSEANMALYYSLLRVWIKFGDSEFAIRSLSAVAGALTVPFLFALGRRLFDTKVALIGAALMAANAFHIRYSQEARGYSLVVLLATMSSLFFVRGIERQSRNDWLRYVLTGSLAVYAHFFGILVLGAQWASVILLRRRDVPWKRLLVSISAICVLLLPLAVFVLTKDGGQLGWVSKVSFSDIYYLVESLSGGGRLLVLAYSVPLLVALFFAVATAARSGASFDTWRYGFLLSWFAAPILVTFAVSLFKPIFVDRFLIICLPPFVLLAAVGLSKLSQRWVLASSVAVLLLLSVRRVPSYNAQSGKEDWKGATSYMMSHASPKDGIVFFVNYGRLGFDYYSGRSAPVASSPKVVFPEAVDLEAAPRLDPDDSLLASLPTQYDQIWLFVRFDDLDPALLKRDHSIEALLASEYSVEKEHTFQGVRVLQYSGSTTRHP